MESPSSTTEPIEEALPGVSDRARAAITDGVILIILLVISSMIISSFESVPDSVRMITFIFIFVLYDPLFTSLFGGTLGHYIMGIKVKHINHRDKNINIVFAIMRYLVKALLGWISLFTVGQNKYRLAIHDYVGQSIVLYNSPKDK
ncbi:RDD family protein [bacterium]|nr:RDD family protein [bacterium]